MVDLLLSPDPSVWDSLPEASGIAAWYEDRVASAPVEARDAAAAAAALALRARLDTELNEVLLLSDPAAGLYATLGIIAIDTVAPSTEVEAVQIATALAPSEWQPAAVPFEFGAVTGWRVTTLDDEADHSDGTVVVPQTVSTVYVAAVRGRCVVAFLSPMTPLAAALVQRLAEQVVSTFDVVESASDVY